MNEKLNLGLSILSVVLLVLANIQLIRIMSNQSEAAKALRDATTQLNKISAESTQTLAKVDELQAVIDAGNEVTPELQAAVDALKAQVQAVDDLVPDITDGSGSTGENGEERVLGVDAKGIQTGVGPNGETGKRGPTAQL